MRFPASPSFPRRRPVSVLAALLLLFIAALVLAVNPGPAQAQTTVKLVGNTGQTSWGVSDVDFDFSETAFTTGSNVGGYVLKHVEIVAKSGSGSTFSATVREGSRTGTSLGTLTNPTLTGSLANARFTASGNGIALKAKTTYVVVLAGTGAKLDATTSDNEDSGGATGWSIANTNRIRGGTSSGASLRMEVHGYANNAPTVANPIPDRAALAGTALSYAFPANTFADADTSHTLTYTAKESDDTALPSWLTFTASTRTFSGTPAAGNAGTLSVKVTASDGFGGTVSDTFDIVVKANNAAPTVANAIPDQTAVAGTAFSYAFPANTFNDADTGDTLAYSATKSDGMALPSWLTFTAGTRAFSGTPAAGDAGTLSVKVTASDGFGGTVSDTFDIVVKASNAAPTVANRIPNRKALAGTAFSYAFPANTFADTDTGDTLSYTATKSDNSALPSWLTFTAGTRLFSGTPAAGDAGTLSVKVTASDGFGGTVSDIFDIVVKATNSAPTVANAISDRKAAVGNQLVFRFPANTFNDADTGDTLTYTATKSDGNALPSWLTFTAGTRLFSGTPATGDVGTLSVKVTASDGFGATVSDTFDIVVQASNTAPTVANPIPDQLDARVGRAWSFTIPANTFADADGDTLTIRVVSTNLAGPPPWLTYDANTRILSGTPAAGDVRDWSIDVLASDGIVEALDHFWIRVTQPTVTAVAVSSTPSLDTDNDGTPETYGLTAVIRVKLTFSEAVTVTGTPRLKIKMDPNFGEIWAIYESGSGSANLVFAHTVIEPNRSPTGIAVLENTLALNGGTIRAGTTNAALGHSGLAHDAGHKVDSERAGTPQVPQTQNPNPGRQPVAPPDPPNLARNPVAWSPVGGMQALPTAMSEVSANKPKGATGSLDLGSIAASVREELRGRSRGFYLTTMVYSPGERRNILSNLDHELARGSPLLKVSIWHVYRRASTGINTIELLGEVFLPRKVNLLAEPVKICLPAPSADADRARIAVRGRTDSEWTILETTLEDGKLCAETVRVSWFVIVLEPEPEDA